jgi:hypothetical protein
MKLVDKKRAEEWGRIRHYSLSELAEVVGRRLFNNILVAAGPKRREADQRKVATAVAVGESFFIPMRDLFRVEEVARELGKWIASSHILLTVEHHQVFENPGGKREKEWAVIVIVASYGDALPIRDANLSLVGHHYRRLEVRRKKLEEEKRSLKRKKGRRKK